MRSRAAKRLVSNFSLKRLNPGWGEWAMPLCSAISSVYRFGVFELDGRTGECPRTASS